MGWSENGAIFPPNGHFGMAIFVGKTIHPEDLGAHDFQRNAYNLLRLWGMIYYGATKHAGISWNSIFCLMEFHGIVHGVLNGISWT